jgi:hypothetical protein
VTEELKKREAEKRLDPYYLPLPKFQMKLTQEQIEHEKQLRDQRKSAYKDMVQNTDKVYHILKSGLLKMTDKLKGQLEEYRRLKLNFPKDADGIYILLEGSVTVKNKFNQNDPEGSKREPPVELYPVTAPKAGLASSPDRNRGGSRLR